MHFTTLTIATSGVIRAGNDSKQCIGFQSQGESIHVDNSMRDYLTLMFVICRISFLNLELPDYLDSQDQVLEIRIL